MKSSLSNKDTKMKKSNESAKKFFTRKAHESKSGTTKKWEQLLNDKNSKKKISEALNKSSSKKELKTAFKKQIKEILEKRSKN